jgi:ADP-ribose pyrophosphatase YjhB (NUDIX family)
MRDTRRVAVKLVADIAVVADRRVLLVRYEDVSRYDGQRGWFLPDDYLAHGEHPDAAARRVPLEQAGLQLEPALAEIESLANGAWHLIFHYRAAAAAPDAVRPRGNVAAAKWFPLDALPPDDEQAHDGWAREVLSRIIG